MGSKRKIQINNKRNKKNKKTRKQKGGLFDPFAAARISILQMRLMKAQMNLQVAFLSQDPTKMDPKKACEIGKTTMDEINEILPLMSKEKGLDIIVEFLKPYVKTITDAVNDPGCPAKIMDTIKETARPMIDEIAGKISAALPGILKDGLKGGREAFKTFLSTPAGSALGLPIKANEVDAFYDNDFIQKVLADTPAPEASGDSGDSGAASTGDSGAASTGDSGAASTGSSSAPGSQFKDDPEKGVELAKKKIATHKKEGNEAKVAKYEKSLETYQAMVSGGGRTKRNKKNKKRKTIKIKCL